MRFLNVIVSILLAGCAMEGGVAVDHSDDVDYSIESHDSLVPFYDLEGYQVFEDYDYGGSDGVNIGEYELQLIEQVYGELTKEEWEALLAELEEFSDEELEAWISTLEDYVEEMNDGRSDLASCSGYYGSRIGYGFFNYSGSSNYSHLWSPNCYFWSSQCGSDPVLSFWMGPDYRGNQNKLKAYASSSVARAYLKYWEGGYSGEIYQGGSYYNFYACWPWQLYYYKEKARLKQKN